MQTVLSIDTTRDPAIAVIVNIDGNKLNVVETRELQIPIINTIPVAAPAEQQATESASTQEQTTETWNTDQQPPVEQPQLQFNTQFTSAVAIIPPHDYLSFNVALPFNDNKQLNKLVEPELQDTLPFESNDLLLSYTPTGAKVDDNYDIHVSAAPKTLISNTISVLKKYGIDPMAISTPAGVLDALGVINPTLIASNAVLVHSRGDFCSVSFRINAAPRSEKIINRKYLPKPVQGGAYPYGAATKQADPLLRQIKVAITAAEKKYNVQLDHVYLVGEELERGEVASVLERSVVVLRLSDLVESSPLGGELAVLGAVYGQDEKSPNALTNFRIGDFSYRPPLRELLLAAKAITPYCIVLLGVIVLWLAAVFITKSLAVNRLKAAVSNQIKLAAPSLTASEGQELEALNAETTKLSDQLKDLGSPQASSPVEALAQITEAFPNIQNATIEKISIKGTRIKVEGCAPDYSAVEQIERALKRQHAFANVKKQVGGRCPSGVDNSVVLSLDITMSE